MMRFKGNFSGLIFIICVVAAIICFSGRSFAASSYDVISFRPPAVGSNYFGLFGSRPLGHMQYTFGLDASYNYKPLDYVNVRGDKSEVIRQLVLFQAGGGLGLWNRFDFGFSFPAGYESITPIGQTNRQSRFRAGDAELEIKVGLLNLERYPVGLSLVPFITFPTGSTANYLGDGVVTGGALVAFESEFLEKKFGLLLNLGYRFRSKTVKDDVNVDDQFLYGLGVHYRIIPQIDLIAEAQGATTATNLFKQTRQTPVIARGGFRYVPRPKTLPVSAYTGGGSGVIAGLGVPKAQVVAGGRYTGTAELYLSKKAEDKTAIYAMAANCMGRPVDMSGECFSYFELKEREVECAGIVEEMTRDLKERCLSVWELKDAEKEIGSVVDLAVSCASGTAGDKDCMAYYDLEVKAEKCPSDYGSFDPWQHTPSCLKMLAVKRMSEEAQVAKASVAELPGAPARAPAGAVASPIVAAAPTAAQVAESTAARRIMAAREKELKQEALAAAASEQAEKKAARIALMQEKEAAALEAKEAKLSAARDRKALRDAKKAARIALGREEAEKVAASRIAAARAEAVVAAGAMGPVSLDAHFKTASVLVEREYIAGLIDLAKYIKTHPDIGKILIEGHADDVGAKNYNDRLSLRRANAVKRYLVKMGVPADMLETAGYGFSRPAVEGKTPEARQANRRVEFRLVGP